MKIKLWSPIKTESSTPDVFFLCLARDDIACDVDSPHHIATCCGASATGF